MFFLWITLFLGILGLNFEDVCDNNLQSEIYKSKQYLKVRIDC